MMVGLKDGKLDGVMVMSSILQLLGIIAIASCLSIITQPITLNNHEVEWKATQGRDPSTQSIVLENRSDRSLSGLVVSGSRGIPILFFSLGLTSVVLISKTLNRTNRNHIFTAPKNFSDRENESFNHILWESNPAFFVVIGIDGKVKKINKSMLEVVGYTAEEAIGLDYLSHFVPEADRAELSVIFEHHYHSLEPIHHQNRILTKEGQELLVEWNGRSIANPETNQIEYFVGLGIDITDRQRRETEIHLLYQLTQAVSESKNFDHALAVTMELICEATRWDIAEAWIPSAQKQELVCSRVWYQQSHIRPEIYPQIQYFRAVSEQIAFPPHVGLPGRVWGSQKTEWVFDISQGSGDLFFRNKVAAECGIKAGLGVPIVANNHILAVLVFFRRCSQERDSKLMELVASVAMQLGSMFESKQAEAKYRSIFENSMEGIFQTTPEGKMIGANPALAKIYGYESAEDLMDNMADVEHQLYVNPESRKEFKVLLQEKEVLSQFEAEIYRRDGSIIWILERARGVKDNQGKLLYYEGSVVDITEQKQQEKRLRYYASHDSLTGLINRAYFIKALAKANARYHENPNYQFAVLFIDLDGFKSINDSMGHWVGDLLLIAIAWTLRQCISEHDTIARLGGDEFTILVENQDRLQDVINIANQIHEHLEQPFKLGGHDLFMQASIGIAYNLPENQDVDDILRNADIAMYRAKKQGKNCTVVFDWTMRQEAMERMQIETDLRLLLYPENKNHAHPGEFYVYYQPIVALGSGKIIGFESLIRWYHPERGFVSPGMFIPVAEESGLIGAIGEWVLLESCRQLKQWHTQFRNFSHLKMSVNLSSRQLTPNLCDRIDQILAEADLPGKYLKLEITETAIMEDPESAIAIFHELKKRNIELSIDDFGTGYCSLAYLHRFPVDTLKVDRSFVQKITQWGDNTEIIHTIISLAHSLGMETIAEGIETIDQMQQLCSLNCTFGQGYFFAKPLDAEHITRLLQDKKRFSVNSNLHVL